MVNRGALCIGAVMLAAIVELTRANVTVTLTENGGAGKTYSDTRDTRIEWSSSSMEYNYGAVTEIAAGGDKVSSYWRMSLIRFDLSAMPEPKSVVSATLRLYQTTTDTGIKAVQRMLQDWVEGSGSGTYGSIINGCGCYARTGSRNVDKAAFTASTHMDQNVWYIDGIGNLALDPVDGIGHRIARFDSTTSTFLRGYDIVYYKLTPAATLDSLATNFTQGAYAYYYDAGASRVYLRFNTRSIGWFSTDDLWSDSIWDGSQTKGPNNASADTTLYYDTNDPNPAGGWYEFDVTQIVTDWLLNQAPNYGVRLLNRTASNTAAFTSSEGADGQRPELVIEYVPEGAAGTLIMVK